MGSVNFAVIFGLLVVLVIYFVPSIVAGINNSKYLGAIVILNLLLGWTLIGWVAAIIWAIAGPKDTDAPMVVTLVAQPASTAETRPCPMCAEPILLAARKCKHCQSEFEPVAHA